MAHPPPHFGRRDFLRAAAATGIAIGIGPAPVAANRPTTRHTSPARNIIVMIADGMSIGTLTLADMHLQQHHQRSCHWVNLWQQPGVRRAMAATFAADALVTDSAAAATAMSTGHRVNNGAICFTPDQREPTPILVRAKKRGIATGLITTTRITHATPAAFIANTPSRDQERQIAAQLLSRGVDIALGGGESQFDKAHLEALQNTRLIRTRDELLALSAPLPAHDNQDRRPILGLFATSHMAYEIDRPSTQPSLAEMTRAALDHLSPYPNGFLVQIEGGRIDHAAHANDAASLIRDQIAFDDALGLAVEFTASRGDTLLIVTTDHANANPGLTIYGEEGNRRFRRLADARHSFEWISTQLRRIETSDQRARALPDLIKQATSIELAPAELTMLTRLSAGEPVHPLAMSNSLRPVLGAILAGYSGVAFLSPNHTSDFVEVTALGPGSENLPPMLHLTDLHTLITTALNLPTE